MTTTLTTMFALSLLQATAVARPELAAPSPAVRTGRGLRISGAVITAIGGALLVGGLGMFIAQAHCQARLATEPHASGECWWLVQGLWMAPAGLVTTSIGVPLLVTGERRHRRWRAWRAPQPRISRIRGGWAVALELRF